MNTAQLTVALEQVSPRIRMKVDFEKISDQMHLILVFTVLKSSKYCEFEVRGGFLLVSDLNAATLIFGEPMREKVLSENTSVSICKDKY